MNLYEITQEFKQFESMDWDKQSEVYKTTLESMEMTLQDKGKNIVSLLSNWNSDTMALDLEIDRLQGKKKVLKNKHDQLKEWLRFSMEQSGINNIKCPLFSITLRKAVENNVLVVDDNKLLFKNYTKEIEPTINTVKLKSDLKSGVIVKGAHLESSKRGLIIK